MNRSRVEQILARFPGKTVLVIGDIMLDEFIWGKVRRISPEAPVPVVEVTEETYRLGGSGNVAANILALGGKPIPIGIVGQDTSGLVRNDRPTTLKTRIIAHSQQVVRADRESKQPVSSDVPAEVVARFLRHLPSASAVIVSDYNKGVVSAKVLSGILPQARSAAVPVFVDPKIEHADYYRPITIITPNQREAELLTGTSISDEASLKQAGHKLLEKFGCEYALITRGEDGMSLFDAVNSHHLPTFAREVFDVTGAGDTVIATLCLAYAAGASIEECATLANHAAGIVVGKVGTATLCRSELLSDFVAHNAHSAG